MTVIGLDLGNTDSRVGVYENQTFLLIADDNGYNSTPSHVAYKNGGFLVGYPALAQASYNPKGTFYNVRWVLDYLLLPRYRY